MTAIAMNLVAPWAPMVRTGSRPWPFLMADTESDLIAAVRRGDQSAWRALVERHEGAVAAVVVGMLGAGDEADDVG